MPTPPRPSSILAVIRAGVQALRRRLYVVIYPLRPARPWRFPVATRPMQADSASDPGVLLEGYLVSELEAAERELFESWLALDDTRELTVAALRHPYDRDNGTPADSDPNVGDWWEECRQRIHTPENDPPDPRTELKIIRPSAAPSFRWHVPAAWAGLAASILCASLGVWALHTKYPYSPPPAHPPERSYATARGERAVIALDGAMVVLGPASVLRISGTYGAADRTVSLTGHAYFNVTHDARHPFRVWAGGVLTEDIGTRFDIRNDAPDAAMRLVVADGAVAVHTRPTPSAGSPNTTAPIAVSRGMMATAGADGVVRVRSGITTDRYLAWRDGRLAFDDTPLPAVVAELSRWYDIDIRLGDPRLASRTLTASFDDPPAAVLIALQDALGVRATRVGRVMTLYPP